MCVGKPRKKETYMSKNLTRKGLAFGAMIALGASSLVAAPAIADTTGPVTLVPNAGTTFNSILQSGAVLSSSIDPLYDSNKTLLTYRVENAGAAKVTLTYDGKNDATDLKQTVVTSATALTNGATGPDATAAGSLTAANATDLTAKFIYISGSATNDSGLVDNTLTIGTAETTKNVTLKVTAWVDLDGDGFIDTFEPSSDTETVVLYAPSNVSATTTIDYLVADNSAFRTKIVYNNSINPWFVQAKTFNRFYKEGVLVDITDTETDTADDLADDYAASAITATTTAYSTETTIGITKNTLMGGVNTSGVGVAYNMNAANDNVVDLGEAVFTAQTFYLTSGSNYVAIGAASPAIDTNGSTNTLVDTLEPTVTNTANLKFDADTNSASAVTVRTGTKTFDVAVQALDDSATPKTLKAAGIRVRATVTAVTLDAGAVSVTGSSASLVEDGVTVAQGFTNASGIATFTINSTVGSEDDVVTAKFEILDSNGVWRDADTLTATWADATLASWKAVGGNYTSGSTVNLTFAAYDQWGEPVSTDDDAALSVSAVASFAGIANATKYSKTVSVTNGVAEFSFANFAAAGASAQLVATLKAGTSNATPTTGSATITVNVYNTNATDKIVVADTFQTAINYNDYVTGKTSSSAVTAAATKSGIASAAKATITGNVLDVNGVGQPGVAVTVAAAGVLLKDASAYAEGTITTYSNEYGSFSVDVFAHELNTAGIAVSITADGKTASTKVKTFLPAAIDDKNLSFSWNFPANVVKNTTYAVTAKLADKWGNPIAGKDAQGNQDATDFAIAFQGTGSIEVNGVGTTVYRDFNTKGEVTVFVRSIKDIAGPGSVSATLGGNALYATGEDATSTSQLGTVAATIALNDETTVWDESKWASTLSVEVDVLDRAPAATGKVNVGSFNGKLVVYALNLDGAKISWKVAGKWGVAVADGNELNRFDRPVGASGVNVIVEIYVNGVKQLTKTVLTK
jgi:trimeric autotransporter adhesin